MSFVFRVSTLLAFAASVPVQAQSRGYIYDEREI